MINAILVDDEPLARAELYELLNEDGRVKVVAQFDNALTCLTEYQTLKADVLFVDIHMPQLSGMDLLNIIHGPQAPAIILVTAYQEYALAAFEGAAFDYLLKPVEETRLKKTLTRLLHHLSSSQLPADSSAAALQFLSCSCRQQQHWVRCENIEYAFSDLCGVHIYDGQQLLHTQLTLKVLEKQLNLLRCHRQYLINPKAIHHLTMAEQGNGLITTESGATVPISRRYLRSLKESSQLTLSN